MNFFNKKLALTTIIGFSSIFAMNSIALADAKPGDIIITLGEDLNPAQKEQLLSEMGVKEESVDIVYVSNNEEHQYLGNYIPKAQIGTKAMSSAKITLGEENSGLMLETNNINYISEEMYLNALSTAGVSDAKIYVSSPVSVSGTGALTGIIKAYEVSSGAKISEEQKQVANEEMVTTAKLAASDSIGEEKAVTFMTEVKEEIAKENPQTTEDLTTLIERVALEMGIALTVDELNQLVELFNKIKEFNIDWEAVSQSIDTAKEKWNNFTESEEGKNIAESFTAFVQSIWDWVLSIFSNK